MFYLIILLSIIVFIAVKIYNAQEEKLQTQAYSKRREEQKAKQHFEKWTQRYGNEDALRMVAGKLWIGMSLEQLMAVKGQPNIKREQHLKTIYEFGGIVNGVVVTVEDSKVVNMVDR